MMMQIPANTQLLSGPAGDAAAINVGMVKVQNTLLQKMSGLGIQVEQAGVLRTDRGFAFATKEVAWGMLEGLKRLTANADREDLCEMAGAIVDLAKAIQLLSGKNISHDDSGREQPTRRLTFEAGQNVHFHVHNEAKKDSPNPVAIPAQIVNNKTT
jgi:hypothetical protein